MKINKMCTGEIIECETTENEYTFRKKYFDLEGNYKKEKIIHISEIRIGNKFCSSVEKAFDYLVNNEGYRRI